MSDYCLNCMEPLAEGGLCEHCGPNAQLPARIAHHLPPGTKLANGRYLVGRALGQGGFGITYIGRDLTLNMRVAIKEYFPTLFVSRAAESTHAVVALAPDDQKRLKAGRQRFLNEARVLAKFHGNPGIVDVRDFFEQNETAYIVMDYLEGETLKDYLRHETIEANRAFDLIQPILDTLELIHANNVIHRDISPDNIMLCSNGNLCLMDFGAAHELEFGDQRTVSMVLKSGYAPEEQYRARGELGPWTDIYSLCATLYWAITGVAPDESLQRLIGDEIVWPSEMGIEISPDQERVLKKGMAPKRSERYQCIADMKADLAKAVASVAPAPFGLAAESGELISLERAGAIEEPVSPVPEAAREEPASPQPEVAREKAASPVPEAAREKAASPQPEAASEEPTSLASAALSEGTISSEATAACEEPVQLEPAPAAASPIVQESPAQRHQESPVQHQEPTAAPQKAKPKHAGRGKLVAILVAIAIACAVAFTAYYLLAPAYTVSFDSAGGSTVEPVALSRTQAADEPTPPTRKNYNFTGWYLDDELKQKADFPLQVDADTTLHAAWKKVRASYRVEYVDAADGTQLAKPKTVEDAQVGKNVTEKAPAVSGYVVDGKGTTTLKVAKKDSANVATFKYLKLASYEVRYLDQASEEEVSPAKTVNDVAEGTQVSETAPAVDGYTLQSESEQSLTIARDSKKNVITFYYELTPVVAEPVYVQSYSGSRSSNRSSSSGRSSSGSSNDVVWAN